MATGRISKRSVDAIQAADRDQYLWDTDLSGFGLKVTRNDTRTYLVQYRMGGRGTPTRRVTIGQHGSPWSPSGAREEAERLLELVRRGIDPQDHKAERQREQVDLAFDRYAQRFLDLYGPKHWSANTLADNKRYVDRYLVPALGRKALPTIGRADVADLFDNLPAGKAGLARNVYALLRKLFAWAVERGDLHRSPVEGFRGPPPVRSRDRVLSDEELALVWEASADLSSPFTEFYRLLISTGQRREEVAGLQWRELDRDAAEWRLPRERSKNDRATIIPLSTLALQVIDDLAGGDTWPRKGLALSTTGKTPISGFSKAKVRLDAAMLSLSGGGEEIAPWRIHDLRRTLATGLQRLGVRFEVTEAVLNHVSGARSGVAGVYQRHDWREEKRAALDAWAAHIQALVDG